MCGFIGESGLIFISVNPEKCIFFFLYGISFFFSPPAVSCKKLDGGPADVAACLNFAGPMPQLTQSCQLPCQDDCQLTAWSKFSSCAADCVGVRTRKRTLVGKCWISRSNDNFLMQGPHTGFSHPRRFQQN